MLEETQNMMINRFDKLVNPVKIKKEEPWEGMDIWRSNTFQNTLAPNTQTHFLETLSGRRTTGDTLGSLSDPTHH